MAQGSIARRASGFPHGGEACSHEAQHTGGGGGGALRACCGPQDPAAQPTKAAETQRGSQGPWSAGLGPGMTGLAEAIAPSTASSSWRGISPQLLGSSADPPRRVGWAPLGIPGPASPAGGAQEPPLARPPTREGRPRVPGQGRPGPTAATPQPPGRARAQGRGSCLPILPAPAAVLHPASAPP